MFLNKTLLLLAPLLVGLGGVADPEEAKEDKREKTGTQEALPLTDLEKKFRDALTNVVLSGKWRLVEEGKLGGESDEKYTISSATKVGADLWMIVARIQYGEKDVKLPVPVKVYWAGDTPVISVTKAVIPFLGTYTARVMIYGGYYTGTWSGPGHGGFMSGLLVHGDEKKKDG
jgi:hypothetical protein